MLSVFWIIVAILLVLLNAFFVAAEFGMVKLRHTRLEIIEENYGLRGKILKIIHKNLDAYLSACQLGITLASLGLGWVGEPAFSDLFQNMFIFFGVVSPHAIHFLSFFIAFSFISFLHIVLGELMPKSLAIRQSERISVWTALPLYAFYWIMFPAIWFLNTCSNILLRLFRLNKSNKNETFFSTDEIKFILSSSHVHGELTKDETEILEHTLDFADLEVTDVMRPIDEMVSLQLGNESKSLIEKVLETRYSRYPVIDANNNIIGIVHVKDLFKFICQGDDISLEKLMRPILKVNDRTPVLDLLQKFRSGTPHFAVVYHGESAIGFVTLDNLLHVMVGRIKDEFHRTKDDWIVLPDGGFLMSGSSSVYTIERALDIEIISEENVATLYGLILNKLGRLPIVGERIEFDDFAAIIEEMKGARLTKVKVIKLTE